MNSQVKSDTPMSNSNQECQLSLPAGYDSLVVDSVNLTPLVALDSSDSELLSFCSFPTCEIKHRFQEGIFCKTFEIYRCLRIKTYLKYNGFEVVQDLLLRLLYRPTLSLTESEEFMTVPKSYGLTLHHRKHELDIETSVGRT